VLSRPDIDDDTVATVLRRFGLRADRVDFLPIGNDAAAWAYRARTSTGESWFVKLRAGQVNLGAHAVPRYLNDHGIRHPVAPVPALDGSLHVPVGRYSLALYPFVCGPSGMDAGLSPRQRVELGTFLRSLHATSLPGNVARLVRRELFVPPWAATVRTIRERASTLGGANRAATLLADTLRSRAAVIDHALRSAEALGRRLRDRKPELVPCHGDLHTANLLVEGDHIRVVDWDEVVLAPPERDLMFVVPSDEAAEAGAGWSAFADGYGPVAIDPLALAYYRYEWVVQEIGDYGARIVLDPNSTEETRADAVSGLLQLFEPGDVVDAALRTPSI